MDVGESNSVPVEREKKQSNFVLIGFLIFFVIAIVGLSGGLIYINFFRPKEPEKLVVSCDFANISEVSDEITNAMRKSESEELDLLKAYSEQCENREFKYEFLLAYILELDKDVESGGFGYYDLALAEMDKINFPEVTPRLKDKFYTAYSVIYKDLLKRDGGTMDAELKAEYEAKVKEYEDLSVAAYKDYYGCMGEPCDEN